jgi:hypothetical protein
VSADGKSILEGICDTLCSGVFGFYDAYGWIVPAVLLTALLFALMIFLCWALEDIPTELEIFRARGAIFKWARSRWAKS